MSEITDKVSSKDGVNISEEAKFSSFAGSICKASYDNSKYVEVMDMSEGSFRGPRPFNFKNLPAGYFIEATADGIGTKGIVIDAAKTHKDAGYDIIAMTASDVTRFGGIPLVFVNIFDTVSIGRAGDEVSETYKSAIAGLGKVAKESQIVLLKGETAQMGDAIGSEIKDSKTKLNWSGVMIGAYHKDKMITGQKLAPDQVILAFKEEGFRSNGLSSARKALRDKFGEEWWKNEEAKDSIREVAHPSVLYDVYVNTLHGWHAKDFKPEVDIKSIVHLSGGALKEKLAKDILFPKGLSAELFDLWEPPLIMRKCAEWHGVSDNEFYEVWNGGQGMLLIVDQKDVEHCIKRGEEFGIKVKVAGKITKEAEPKVVINSKLTSGMIIIYK